MKPKKVVLIDDHAVFRSGMRMLICAAFPDCAILEFGSLFEALDNTAENVDVVFLDIMLGGISGMEGIAPLKQKWPRVHVLMLSAQNDSEVVQQAQLRGATGFFSKADTSDNIINSLTLIFSGQITNQPDKHYHPQLGNLTLRQIEVLSLLHKGQSNKQIANTLSLSNNTVRRHVQDILQFYGVSSRAQAVASSQSDKLLNQQYS